MELFIAIAALIEIAAPLVIIQGDGYIELVNHRLLGTKQPDKDQGLSGDSHKKLSRAPSSWQTRAFRAELSNGREMLGKEFLVNDKNYYFK